MSALEGFKAEVGKDELIEVVDAMIPAPLTFFEVDEEHVFSDAAKLGHSEFSKAPEGFNAVDMVLPPGKFVFMVMNAMVSKTAGHQAIVGFPAVGINVALGKDVSLENGHQFSPGAVLDYADEDSISSFVKAEDRCFPSGSSASLASNPASSEIGFIHFDLPCKRVCLLNREFNHPFSEQCVNSLNTLPTYV